MTETLQCECGQRVQQRVDFISPAYVVTFTDPATTTLILACPGCSRPLYAALRDGALKPAPPFHRCWTDPARMRQTSASGLTLAGCGDNCDCGVHGRGERFHPAPG